MIRPRARTTTTYAYRFLYSNKFAVTNSKAEPANLRNGFLARITTDFDQLSTFESIFDLGDPIDFDTGAGRCDPL